MGLVRDRSEHTIILNSQVMLELLVLAIAPSVMIFMIFYLRDKYDREPWALLLKTFILGSLITIPVAFIEQELLGLWGVSLSNPSSLVVTFLTMIFLIALVEESAKFAVVRVYAWKKSAFNEPYDGIMYTIMASLGFATVENILYVFQNGEFVAWLRAFLTVPMHALSAVIMGYFIGVAKYGKTTKEKSILYNGLFIAILMHGFFNFFIASNQWFLIPFAPVVVGLAWYFGLKASKIHAKNSPFKEKGTKK